MWLCHFMAPKCISSMLSDQLTKALHYNRKQWNIIMRWVIEYRLQFWETPWEYIIKIQTLSANTITYMLTPRRRGCLFSLLIKCNAFLLAPMKLHLLILHISKNRLVIFYLKAIKQQLKKKKVIPIQLWIIVAWGHTHKIKKVM